MGDFPNDDQEPIRPNWGDGDSYSWFSPEEWEEWRNLQPEDELWPLPDDAPEGLEDELPGEVDVEIIFQGYYGDDPPEGWSMGLAQAMVNMGRRRVYKMWEERWRGQ